MKSGVRWEEEELGEQRQYAVFPQRRASSLLLRRDRSVVESSSVWSILWLADGTGRTELASAADEDFVNPLAFDPAVAFVDVEIFDDIYFA